MDAAHTFLLALLDIAATQARGRSPVAVDLPALLAAVAPAATAAALTPLFAEIAQGRSRVDQLLARIDELAPSLADGGAQATRLTDLADRVQTIAALAKADPAGVLSAATIDLAGSPLAELVATWYLDGTPASCVVNMAGISQAERVVQPRGDHFLERRLRLRYRRDDPFPRIESDAPLTTAYNSDPAPHGSWRQRDLPDYDVQLYSEQGRHMGEVRTRRRTPGGPLVGAGLTLQLAFDPDASLLVSELRDVDGQTLLEVWRWPPL